MASMSSLELQPGFRRRISLYPSAGLISAGLEDDYHRFLLELTHAEGVVTGLRTKAERYPWSTCSGAGEFLGEQITGRRLEEIASLDPRLHCTHLIDLVILSAAHAGDTGRLQFDLFVADRNEGRTWATLTENRDLVLRWELNGTVIDSPDEWSGRDLRRLSTWQQDLAPQQAERAKLMRRAVFISGGRALPKKFEVERAADRGPERMGACFTYQMPRALDAVQSVHLRRDFSLTEDEPLEDYDSAMLRNISSEKGGSR